MQLASDWRRNCPTVQKGAKWQVFSAAGIVESDGNSNVGALSRLTFQVAMDNVDLVGVVVDSGYVSKISYVAW